jgi:hypothetical protein
VIIRFYNYGSFIGLSLLDDQLNRQRNLSTTAKKRSSVASQRQKTSASIVTQKTTLPQIETITQRDQVYQVRIIILIINFLIYFFLLF